MSKWYWIAISLFILTMLTSCSRKPSAILGDSSCTAPCWRGIQPGKTTIQEAKAVVIGMQDIVLNSFGEKTWARNPYLENEISWRYVNDNEDHGEIYFRDDLVTLIHFSIGNSSLLHHIKMFGEPTLIFIKSMEGDPAVYLTVDIIYRDAGICLSHEPSLLLTFKNPETYRIKPSTKIRDVSFIDPSLPNGQILSGCLAGLDENTYLTHQQEWKGYGEYDVFTWDDIR